jgi:hypothetical protein
MTAFLITWRPTGELKGSGWPEAELLKLVRKHAQQGTVVEPWTFRPYRIAKKGDRIFLIRQGNRGHVLFGYGRISEIPKPYEESVDVKFEGLVDPGSQAFATDANLNAITNERMVWGTRHSGYKLPRDVADRLEALVVGRTPIELEPSTDKFDGMNQGRVRNSQNQEARRLLSVIKRILPTHRLLTYKSAALELGRSATHARAVAQVCDLLDAATALAQVPLLALIAVREASGDINRKAWTGSAIPAGLKDRIVKQSLAHSFVERDFVAIGEALRQLAGLGNHAAWREVHKSFGGTKALYRSLAAHTYDNNIEDAIADLGSDEPRRKDAPGATYIRDPNVRKEVERRANGRCEFCGEPGFPRRDGSKYVETHHIIALARDGADRVTNVIGLCPNHHKEAHFGSQSNALEQEMIGIVKRLYDQRTSDTPT